MAKPGPRAAHSIFPGALHPRVQRLLFQKAFLNRARRAARACLARHRRAYAALVVPHRRWQPPEYPPKAPIHMALIAKPGFERDLRVGVLGLTQQSRRAF